MSQYNGPHQQIFGTSDNSPENLSWYSSVLKPSSYQLSSATGTSPITSAQSLPLPASSNGLQSSIGSLLQDDQQSKIESSPQFLDSLKMQNGSNPWGSLEIPTMPTPGYFNVNPKRANIALSLELRNSQVLKGFSASSVRNEQIPGIQSLPTMVNPLTANLSPLGKTQGSASPEMQMDKSICSQSCTNTAIDACLDYSLTSNAPKVNSNEEPIRSETLNDTQQGNGSAQSFCKKKVNDELDISMNRIYLGEKSDLSASLMSDDEHNKMIRELNFLREFCTRKFNEWPENSKDADDENVPRSSVNGDLEAAKAILSMRDISSSVEKTQGYQRKRIRLKLHDTTVHMINKPSNESAHATVVENSHANDIPMPLSSKNDNAVKSYNQSHAVVSESGESSESVALHDSIVEQSSVTDANDYNVSQLISSMSPFLNTALLLASQQTNIIPSADISKLLLTNPANLSQESLKSTQQLPQPIMYKCQICKFNSTSKFHYNSHMNTHADHKCSFCDYTSRTIGRLKRHMNDFHTHDAKTLPVTNGQMQVTQASASASNYDAIERSNSNKIVQQSIDIPLEKSMIPCSSNSSGKPKTYRCKTCNMLLHSKIDQWTHQRTHIKSDRILSCPKCLFVTEYKHHLEYHLHNHFGSKPFKCQKCNYTCVNKSMLNSHMKSHSNFYPHRCVDCRYTTKYPHSLKLHLQKYGHTSVTHTQDSPEGLDDPQNGEASNSSKSATSNGATNSATFQITPIVPVPTRPSAQPIKVGYISNALSLESLASVFRQQQARPTSAPYGTTLPVILSTSDNQDSATSTDLTVKKQPLKCNICSANFDSKDELTAHMFAHIVDVKGMGGGTPSPSEKMHIVPRQVQILKCNFCYQTNFDSKESLANHLVKHLIDNCEVFRRYGLGTNTSLHPSTSEVTPLSPSYSRMFCDSNAFDSMEHGSAQRNCVRAMEGLTSPEEPDHDLLHDSNSPSSTIDKHSGSDEAATSDPGQLTTFGNKRRKGKAFKLDQISQRLQRCSSASPGISPRRYNDAPTMVISSHQKAENEKCIDMQVGNASRPSSRLAIVEQSSRSSGASAPSLDWSKAHVCRYCEMAFADSVMYAIHMGYHGYQDPYKCNMCGAVTGDKLSMFLHVTQAPHF